MFFTERLKNIDLQRSFVRQYFWRIRGSKPRADTGKEMQYSREIDFIEVRDNNMQAFECKLSADRKDSGGKEFRESYPNCPVRIVSPQDCRELFDLSPVF